MVGVDLISVERIEKAMKTDGFSDRVFAVSELEYASKKSIPSQTLAGFYAAKEAIAKALKLPLMQIIRETEISHDESGAPFAVFSGKTKEQAKDYKVEISISHDGGFAIAVATGEKI
jgi:phosphopantetheine--protein transferase-like protein